jgi:antitoxin HicB
MEQTRSLEELQARQYRYNVIADPEGGWVIEFPDLPGCLTQVDDPAEIGPMAEDAKRELIEAAHELGREIPDPTYPELEEYSGKFVMRVPKKLHRELAEQARRNGVSLNAWVTHLLTERSAQARIVA